MSHPPLYHATKNKHTNAMGLLLECGADPNYVDMTSENSINESLLHLAVSNGNVDSVQLLIDYEADIHVRNRFGYSLFDYAAHYGHIDMLEFLISKGANMNAIEIDWGKHAIHIAACSGSIDSMQWLLDHDIDVDIKDGSGHTPLHWAAYYDEIDAVRFLISKGANVNNMNKHGENVLFDAAKREDQHRKELINILLDHGAKHVYKYRSYGPDPNEIIRKVILSRK
jgi:ankyrin repeat protein